MDADDLSQLESSPTAEEKAPETLLGGHKAVSFLKSQATMLALATPDLRLGGLPTNKHWDAAMFLCGYFKKHNRHEPSRHFEIVLPGVQQ